MHLLSRSTQSEAGWPTYTVRYLSVFALQFVPRKADDYQGEASPRVTNESTEIVRHDDDALRRTQRGWSEAHGFVDAVQRDCDRVHFCGSRARCHLDSCYYNREYSRS